MIINLPFILIKMALSSVVAIAPASACEIFCNNNKYLSYLLNISPSKVLKFIFVHVNDESVLFPEPNAFVVPLVVKTLVFKTKHAILKTNYRHSADVKIESKES